MEISYRNYVFRMCKELCLVGAFPICWLGILLPSTMKLFGLVVVLNGGKICIEKMLGFRRDAVRFFKPLFLSWP